MDDSIARLLAAAVPRTLTAPDVAALEELATYRLPPAAAAWMAPFSPLLPASSSTAASARVLPSGALDGLRYAMAMDQVVRPAKKVGLPEEKEVERSGSSLDAPIADEHDDGLGPPAGVSSSLSVPVSIDGSHVSGLFVVDVVVDHIHFVDDAHPRTRWVYDAENDVVTMAAEYGDGTLVAAGTARPTPDGTGHVIVASMLRRPTTLGAPVELVLRTSTLLHGAAPIRALDRSSPLMACCSAFRRYLGSFGTAAVLLGPDGGGGDGNGVDDGQDEALRSPVASGTMFTELSSPAMVARLRLLTLQQGAVHPSVLRMGPAAPPSHGQPVAIALSPAGRGGAFFAAWPQGRFHSKPSWTAAAAAATAGRAGAPRSRAKVRLEDVTDEATRARILRNRAAAARSNAKRRAQRVTDTPQR